MQLLRDSEVPTAHMVFNPEALRAASMRGLGIAVPGYNERGLGGLSGPGGLSAIIAGGPPCVKLSTNWDEYCDCVWNPADPGEAGSDNFTCKSKPNLTSWLFAPWTKMGSRARAVAALTPDGHNRWSAAGEGKGPGGTCVEGLGCGAELARVAPYFAPGGLHEQRGGTPTRVFDDFHPIFSNVNPVALAAVGVAAAAAVTAVVLGVKGRKKASAAVSGFFKRSRRRKARR